ncbi:MAG: diguanylate cyclase [Gemmatimonadetes bacterium]|nr:diguanylate cyclase [Gemmatimonadota bacterium]MBI2538154.1 diguanylate cyclase [Gemmatimonadota bacterium]
MTADPAPRAVPLRALVLSIAALSVPVLGVFGFPAWLQEEQGMLIWMTSLVPAFLLAYYRGLRGVALALAAGMAVLSLTQVSVLALGVSGPDWKLLLTFVTAYVAICLALGVVAELLHRERRAAESLALIDGLTGLPNRRHADMALDAQFAAAVRGRRLVVVVFDLDRFKRINDQHGHDAGDAALRGFAEVLRRNTRRMDLTARFGGEEFISILGDCELSEALRFAERVRDETRRVTTPAGALTVSAGVARFDQGMGTHEVLVAAADRALYAAKEGGRDRTVVAEQHAGGRPAVRPVAGVAAQSLGAPRGSESVMLIDDDSDVRRSLERLLKVAGYRVEATEDPDEVLRRFEDGVPPDLLISDIVMPRMSGLTLADRLQQRAPGLRVVYLSGYVQEDVAWAGLPGAVVGFVPKPVELKDFLTTVRDVLDRQAG